MRNKTKGNGFTLIELSIVLVIIGLVIGGIMVGKDMIASSSIRAQISQIEEMKTAINTFKVKYGFLPGDMPPTQASQLGFFTFTGAQAGNGCVAAGVAFGNNDGIINFNTEGYALWSHLGDSKLIRGQYGGTAGSLLVANAAACTVGPGWPIIGIPNTYKEAEDYFPNTKLSPEKGFLYIYGNNYIAPNKTTWILATMKMKTNLIILYDGRGRRIWTPYQLYQMDSKMDDGLPASGNVIEFDTEDTPCTTSGVTPIQYDLSSATSNNIICYGVMFPF